MNYLVSTPFRQLERELESVFGDLDTPFASARGFVRGFAPAVDLVETADSYAIRVELPGVDRSDLELSLHEGVLSIKGQKKAVELKETDRYRRRESWSGAFERRVALPDAADSGKVEAVMKDGVLSVSIAKREESKPRSIAIGG